MPRTAALKPEQVPADSKPTLDTFTKNIGFTPNMMATFARSPIAFNSWATLLGSLSKALDVKTHDSIGLAVSEVNGCKLLPDGSQLYGRAYGPPEGRGLRYYINSASLRFIPLDELESEGYGDYTKLFDIRDKE